MLHSGSTISCSLQMDRSGGSDGFAADDGGIRENCRRGRKAGGNANRKSHSSWYMGLDADSLHFVGLLLDLANCHEANSTHQSEDSALSIENCDDPNSHDRHGNILGRDSNDPTKRRSSTEKYAKNMLSFLKRLGKKRDGIVPLSYSDGQKSFRDSEAPMCAAPLSSVYSPVATDGVTLYSSTSKALHRQEPLYRTKISSRLDSVNSTTTVSNTTSHDTPAFTSDESDDFYYGGGRGGIEIHEYGNVSVDGSRPPNVCSIDNEEVDSNGILDSGYGIASSTHTDEDGRYHGTFPGGSCGWQSDLGVRMGTSNVGLTYSFNGKGNVAGGPPTTVMSNNQGLSTSMSIEREDSHGYIKSPVLRVPSNKTEIQELVMKDVLHHLILKWTSPNSYFVELAGTFSTPSWEKRFPLKWCPRSCCHWIDVHATLDGAVAAVGGHHQFKFIVDGKWMCNPSLPICDDGDHNLNNVVIIFPESIMRRTSLRRRESNKQNGANISRSKQLGTGEYGPSGMSKHSLLSSTASQSNPNLTSICDGPARLEQVANNSDMEIGTIGAPPMPTPSSGLKRSAGTDNLSGTVPTSFRSSPFIPDLDYPVSSHNTKLGIAPSYHRYHSDRETDAASTLYQEEESREMNTTIVSMPNLSKQEGVYGKNSNSYSRGGYANGKGDCNMSSGLLSRCNSAYDSGLMDALRDDKLRRVQSMTCGNWPPSVMESLHQPETLFKLNVPVDAKEKSGLTLQCGAYMIPHPDKIDSRGADAYFIAHTDNNRVCVGVADGVGEWDSFGLNPRMFAEQLMEGCMRAFKNDAQNPAHLESLTKELLYKGYDFTHSYGSATALLACLDIKGERIGVANLGDSVMILLRRQRVYEMTCVFRTQEQQHQFNCPYQLSRLPKPEDYDRIATEGNEVLAHVLRNTTIVPQDTPEMGYFASHEVTEGDLIILGTDGVFDNLFDFEICQLANLALSPYEGLLLNNSDLVTSAETVAAAIGEAASFRSKDATAKTPFMRRAREAGTNYIGGKMDDITVVACWVTRGRDGN